MKMFERRPRGTCHQRTRFCWTWRPVAESDLIHAIVPREIKRQSRWLTKGSCSALQSGLCFCSLTSNIEMYMQQRHQQRCRNDLKNGKVATKTMRLTWQVRSIFNGISIENNGGGHLTHEPRLDVSSTEIPAWQIQNVEAMITSLVNFAMILQIGLLYGGFHKWGYPQ